MDKYDKRAEAVLEELRGIYDEMLERPVSDTTKQVVIGNALREIASQAIAEQREKDAQIADEYSPGNSFNPYEIGENIAQAIRSQSSLVEREK